ncbi:MAG: NUDIX domain-containing protein [bacterium]|nr:NUDIX domain-containing protein [bacterium]
MAWTLRRPAARVVLLDRHGRIFLMQASDPIDPRKGPWWEIPGGGLGPGEDSAQGARRELWEEAGFADVEVGPCIWTQHVEFDFAGIHFDSDERIHVAWCPDGGEWNPQHLEALEAAAFEDARWWTLDELLASDDQVLPERLREFLPDVIAGRLPEEPIDISP